MAGHCHLGAEGRGCEWGSTAQFFAAPSSLLPKNAPPLDGDHTGFLMYDGNHIGGRLESGRNDLAHGPPVTTSGADHSSCTQVSFTDTSHVLYRPPNARGDGNHSNYCSSLPLARFMSQREETRRRGLPNSSVVVKGIKRLCLLEGL